MAAASTRSGLIADVANRHAGRFLRYAGVSAVAVTIGQVILLFCYSVLEWPAIAANITAVTLSSIPAYLLNRAWVWGKNGRHSLTAEVLPFWGMALLGLLLSTLAVAWAEQQWESAIAVSLANLSAFGVLWVVKYVILDSWMFAVESPEPGSETDPVSESSI